MLQYTLYHAHLKGKIKTLIKIAEVDAKCHSSYTHLKIKEIEAFLMQYDCRQIDTISNLIFSCTICR